MLNLEQIKISSDRERELINQSLARPAGSGPWLVEEPIARAPRFVRVFRAIDPRRDTKHAIGAKEVLAVERVDADRRGVTVRTFGHGLVSLHPSEFEVLEFEP